MPFKKVSLKSAFTMIEVLVVLAISALLISIITPVVQRALSSSKKVACKSNLYQLATASLMYSANHQGRCAAYSSGLQETDPLYAKFWRQINEVMYNDPDVTIEAATWHCPADNSTDLRKAAAPSINYIISYMFSMETSTSHGPHAGRWTSLHEIVSPGNKVMMADALYDTSLSPITIVNNIFFSDSRFLQKVGDRHPGDTFNAAHWDGSVRAYTKLDFDESEEWNEKLKLYQ